MQAKWRMVPKLKSLDFASHAVLAAVAVQH
jgi:hypothetical protein